MGRKRHQNLNFGEHIIYFNEKISRPVRWGKHVIVNVFTIIFFQFLFLLCLFLAMWLVGSWLPDQGLNPGPRQLEQSPHHWTSRKFPPWISCVWSLYCGILVNYLIHVKGASKHFEGRTRRHHIFFEIVITINPSVSIYTKGLAN